MIRFDIITIFPEPLKAYFSQSIIQRAQKSNKVKISLHNLRNFTDDPHKTVDDKPYGGGPGMILKVEPILKAVKIILGQNKRIASRQRRIILLSAKGKIFTQKQAQRLLKYKQIVLICGHYEGVDERVARYIADEEISIGKYVLTGGELPAMVIVDAITRLVPGVIKRESLEEESFSKGDTSLEYPQYTKPAVVEPRQIIKRLPKKLGKVKYWRVPKVLLSGHHKKIKEWRKKHIERTKEL